MGKIWLKNIEVGLRGTKVFLTLSGIFNGGSAYALFTLANNSLALCLLAYSTYHYIYQIDKLSHIIHHGMVIMDVCAGTIVGYVYSDKIQGIMSDPSTTYHYENQMMSKKMEEVKGVVCRNYKGMFKYMVFSMVYLHMLMNILAICQRYLNDEEMLQVFPCYFPFPIDNYPIHAAVIIWQELILSNIGILVFSALLLTHCIYSHVKTEIDILKFAINNIEERAFEMAMNQKGYSDKNVQSEILRRCYIKCTRMCAQHHSDVIRYFHNAEQVIEIVYFLVFLSGLVVCICTGFALISENTSLKIKFVGITFIEIIFLYTMCWLAEETAEQSQSVGDLVYVMEWYRLPKECQSILIVMMIRAGKPLLMRMLTGQKVDLAAYMALIKASYSYFNMMLATTQ